MVRSSSTVAPDSSSKYSQPTSHSTITKASTLQISKFASIYPCRFELSRRLSNSPRTDDRSVQSKSTLATVSAMLLDWTDLSSVRGLFDNLRDNSNLHG